MSGKKVSPAEPEERVELSEHGRYALKRLVWHGLLRRIELEQLLQVSSDYASRLIARLKRSVPLLTMGKAYTLDPAAPLPAVITAEDFLGNVLEAVRTNRSIEALAGTTTTALVFHHRDDHVDTRVLREIVMALRERQALGIAYTGLGSGEKTLLRVVEPVALVHVADRWHLHAWAQPTASKEGGWRDFVLSRITETHGRFGPASRRLKDSDGMRNVTIHIEPHESLTPDQARVVASMWKMVKGRLSLEMTANQAFYFRQAYVAAEGEGPPKKLVQEIRQ